MANDLPARKTMCATCPFREGSPYAYLKDDLAYSSQSTSRICHSTGSNNAINRRTGRRPHLCRGSRDLQLRLMHALGVIEAATDEAWNKKRVEIGLPPIEIKDPGK